MKNTHTLLFTKPGQYEIIYQFIIYISGCYKLNASYGHKMSSKHTHTQENKLWVIIIIIIIITW